MATTAQKVPATVPAPGVALTDASGNVTPVWFQFFQTLQNRTGSNAGIPIDYVQAQVTELTIESAMTADPVIPAYAAPSAFQYASIDNLWAEDPPAKAHPTFAIETIWADDPPKPPINPFLAALFIGGDLG